MKKRRQSISKHPVVRVLIIWTFEVVGLIVMALLLDGLHIDRVSTAILVVAVTGLLNALLWPILSRILLPIAVFTAGLFFLVLNGFILWLAGQFVDGFNVDSIWTATLAHLAPLHSLTAHGYLRAIRITQRVRTVLSTSAQLPQSVHVLQIMKATPTGSSPVLKVPFPTQCGLTIPGAMRFPGCIPRWMLTCKQGAHRTWRDLSESLTPTNVHPMTFSH